jgi:hypothetical protein
LDGHQRVQLPVNADAHGDRAVVAERERRAVRVAVPGRAEAVHRAEDARRDLDLVAVQHERREAADGIPGPQRVARDRAARERHADQELADVV